MIKTIASAAKQAVFSKSFLVSWIGVVAIIAVSSIQQILEAFRADELLMIGFHDTFIANALVSDGMTLALPILAALPFTASFVDDVKSGYIKAYLPRTTRLNYLTSRCVACAVSGGLVLALGILVSYVISALVFLPMEAPLPKDVKAPSYFAELMENIMLFFCSGAFWSCVGLTFATLTSSKYMAYASPFVLYYVLIILYERYFDALYVLYPKEWTAPTKEWMWGSFGIVLLLLELTIIVCLAFGIAAQRRLSQI